MFAKDSKNFLESLKLDPKQQGKKAFALSVDRAFKADHENFIMSKAKGAELSVNHFL